MKLTEIVRSSRRIVMGSLPFAVEEQKKAIECFSGAAGPPIKAFTFMKNGQQDINYQYATEILKAIQQIQCSYPKMSLDDRVLLIVPDQHFLENVEDHLSQLLEETVGTNTFQLIRAIEAAATVREFGQVPAEHTYAVLTDLLCRARSKG